MGFAVDADPGDDARASYRAALHDDLLWLASTADNRLVTESCRPSLRVGRLRPAAAGHAAGDARAHSAR